MIKELLLKALIEYIKISKETDTVPVWRSTIHHKISKEKEK